MADKSTEGTGKKRRVERRFIDAKTGEEIGKSSVVTAADDVAREVTVHHVTAKGDPGKKRPIAIALWVVAIIFEVLAWLVYNGTIANLPGKLMMWLIIFIVADLACVIIAGQLWKKANHIDPPSEANKASFFLKSQLGAILAAVAFVPVIILMLTDKDADPQTKKIGTIAAAIALAIGMGTSIDYHPVSAEDLAEAEETAIELGTGTVYWTPFGHVYHLNPDCQAIVNSTDIYTGDVQAAFEAGRTRACKFCAQASGSDVLKELSQTDDEATDDAEAADAETTDEELDDAA